MSEHISIEGNLISCHLNILGFTVNKTIRFPEDLLNIQAVSFPSALTSICLSDFFSFNTSVRFLGSQQKSPNLQYDVLLVLC